MRLGCHAHGIVTKTVHKTLPGSRFCLSETGPCAVISSQISSNFTDPPPMVWVSMLFRILGQSGVSNNREFDHLIKGLSLLCLFY